VEPTTTTLPTATGWQTIQADPQHQRYSSVVGANPDVVALLEQPGQVYTMFVPSDAALNALGNWDAIGADPDALMAFVRKHTVVGPYTTAQLFALPPGTEVRNLDGDLLVIDPVTMTINGATVITPDVAAANGVVQTVSAPLFPVELTAPTTGG